MTSRENKISSLTELRAAIVQLEIQREAEGKAIKEQFMLLTDSLKPVNLIKSAFRDAASSTDVKDKVVSTAIGITTGYISKLLVQSVTRGPFSKMLGSAIMFGISKFAARHPETVASAGQGLLKIFRRTKSSGLNGSEKI